MTKRQKIEKETEDTTNPLARLEEALERLKSGSGSEEDDNIATEMFSDCFKDAIIKIVPFFDSFKDIKDILKPDGVLFIEVPNDKIKKVKAMIGLNIKSSHLYFFNITVLIDILHKNRFNIIKVNTIGLKLSKQINLINYK